ncbi:MAG TPA: hypothetical protein VGG79_23910 [Roseiarcus sp.]|jgi:hypothetical protein
MKTEIDYLKRLQFSAGVLVGILVIYNLVLIASRILVNRIYINSMPQDFLALLDGVYRVHLGQIVHRDFSSPLGPFNFVLPASFMSHNAGIISSLNYSEAVYAVLAFLIFLYLLLTRLDRMAGFFLGLWIPLALLARMNFGDPLELVTEAMNYNRRCDVFLLLLLLLFIPSREPNRRSLIIDGLLYGAISAFLFYSKITFGLVALGFSPIMLIRKRDNITVIAVAAIMFLAIAAWVEFVYGTHFSWLIDVRMAGASQGRDNVSRIFHVVRDNALELFALLFCPALILLALRKLTIQLALLCAYVGVVSVLILSLSGQSYVLTLPIAFVFVALDALRPEPPFLGAASQMRTRYVVLSALLSTLLVIESYPLAVNIAIATYRSLRAAPWDSSNEILNKIKTDRTDNNDGGARSLLSKLDKMSKLDIFALARATKPKNYWDNLLMEEYGEYLHTGIAAARQGCGDRARISTIDVVNPFPVLLDWPEGGGMFFAAAGYLTSKKAHLPDEVMFRDIDCVMVPKLPAQIGFRDTLLDIYGPFLSKSFEPSLESDMWTVLRRRAQLSNSAKPSG